MISARLVHQVGIKAAYATPSSSVLRERAALLGITPGGSEVKEQLREDELPDAPMAGFAPAVDGEEGFWPDMPDAVDEAEEEATVAPSQASSLPLPFGQKLFTLRVAPSSSSSGTPVPTAASEYLGASAKARAPFPPQEVKPPDSIVKEELGGKGRGIRVPPKREIKTQAPGLRNWELERERKRQALSLKDAGCKAICAIKHALRQPGAQQDGTAFVPEDWDTEFKPKLGSYIKFLISRPDQFRVIEGSAPGLFTVENVATTELAKAPPWGSWKKEWKGKMEVKRELKSEVKEEMGGGQRGWQPNRFNKVGDNRGGAWRQGDNMGGAWRQGNNFPQQGGWKTEPRGNNYPQQGGWRTEPRGDNASQQSGWRPWKTEPGGPHRTDVKVESGSRWSASASSTMGWRERGSWASDLDDRGGKSGSFHGDDRGGKGGSFHGRVKEEPGIWNSRLRLLPAPPQQQAQAREALQGWPGWRPSPRPSMNEATFCANEEKRALHGVGDPYATEQPDAMYGMDEELREVEALPFRVDGDEDPADKAWAQAEPAGDDAIDAWGLLSEQMRDHLRDEEDAKRPRQS
mmetsp:Transcript_5815/g.11152  ORF Transcript_5815/g.11152 Transcript_5815/m.11152 type:complete len:575 (+) Transcript_5815:57-1781(+)